MSIDGKTFKRVMSEFATGVTILTTIYEGKPVGITANAFCSVSLEPRLVLVCVDKSLYTHSQILKSGIFAISILSLAQMEWADRFAGRYPERGNRFEGIEYLTVSTGAPILPGSLAWVDCELRHSYDGGDHTIFVGEPVAGALDRRDEPLLYYEARWGRLSAEGPIAGSSWPDDESEEEA